MKKGKVIKIINICLCLFTFLYPIPYTLYPAFAQSPSPGAFNIGDRFGFGSIKSLGEGTSRLTTPAFSVAAAVVVLYFLFGVFDFIRSGGEKEGVAKAKNKLTHSLIGFILLIFAFFILQFLLSSLFGDTGLGIIQTK